MGHAGREGKDATFYGKLCASGAVLCLQSLMRRLLFVMCVLGAQAGRHD